MLMYSAGWLNAKAGLLADRSGRRDKTLKSGTVPPKTGRMVSLIQYKFYNQLARQLYISHDKCIEIVSKKQKSSLNMSLKVKLLEVTTFCNFKFIQYKFYNQLARQLCMSHDKCIEIVSKKHKKVL